MEGKGRQIFSVRNIAYLIAFVGLIIGFIYSVSVSQGISATVLRGPGTPFREQTQTTTLNHFQLVLEQTGTIKELHLQIAIQNLPEDSYEIKMQRNPFDFKTNHKRLNVFIVFNNDVLIKGSQKFNFVIKDIETKEELIKEGVLVGPAY